MTTRTLSVVIPAYNAEGNIGATISALARALDRAPAFDTEVILVDDGSTDRTVAVASEAAAGRLHLRILSQPNRGRFAARRAGLDAARGSWVLLLDSRISLDAGALAFVAGRLSVGEEVWNGHVRVLTNGNPYGAFWKAVVEVAWKDYLAAPRAMSFGAAEFDRFPKGTGCFLAPRPLLSDAFDRFRSHYQGSRIVSDDTAVIRLIAEQKLINLAPAFGCDYVARSTLTSFIRQGVYRGTTFVDGHLRRESRFFVGAAAFFPLSLLIFVASLRRPWTTVVVALAGSLAASIAARSNGCSRSEVRSVTLLAPVYALAHGVGMWRGALMLGKALLDRRLRG
jgi:glycosyltransferase involved in cell wall biosynthesis